MEREAHLQGILHLSQKPHLSSSPVKETSLKVPFMESLRERCPTTRATLIHLSKSPVYEPPLPTYQVPLRLKQAPTEREAHIWRLS
jgi:hypothetical protein